jgi:mRNA interferase HigB
MKVVGRDVLEAFVLKHADARAQVQAWLAEAGDAAWAKPDDVKAKYSSVSFLGDNRVVFNIKGNRYRLDVKINYGAKVVLVKRIGTHAEYDGWKF